MLREIKKVKQREGEDVRRWFTDDYWDLYVWSKESGEITGVQLCYDKTGREHALTWFKDKQFHHTKVNFQRGSYSERMSTPVLVADGIFNNKDIYNRFIQDSRTIEKKVTEFVAGKILEYSGKERRI